jgi:hypothetical protein
MGRAWQGIRRTRPMGWDMTAVLAQVQPELPNRSRCPQNAAPAFEHTYRGAGPG